MLTKFKLFLQPAISVGIILTGIACSTSTSSPKNQAEQAPRDFAEWHEQYLRSIYDLREYAYGLNEIITKYHELKQAGVLDKKIGSARASTENVAFGLQQEPDQMNDFIKLMQAQGMQITNIAQRIQAAAAHNKALAEIDAMQIANVGRALENVEKNLDNVIKGIEVQLSGYYLDGYSKYVRAYSRYVKYITGIYAKMDGNATRGIKAALTEFNNYEKQTAICASQARRIDRVMRSEAIQEINESQVSYANIDAMFNKYSAMPNGEACLHRVLLTSHSANDKYLYGVDFAVQMRNGKKKALECATVESGNAPLPDELWENDFDLMEYPQYIRTEADIVNSDGKIKTPAGQVIGMYRPVTYFQLYKLVTDPSYIVTVNPPPANLRDFCHQRLPSGAELSSRDKNQLEYVRLSREFERTLSEQVKIQDEAMVGNYHSFKPVDSTYIDPKIANTNEAYKSLLRRLDGIYSAVNSCVETYEAKPEHSIAPVAAEDLKVSEPEPKAVVDVMPFNNNPDRALMNYDNPAFSKMSASIRNCMTLAENHRQRALEKISLTEMVHKVLAEMASAKPPRAPHPVQLKPANAPLNRAGNDF